MQEHSTKFGGTCPFFLYLEQHAMTKLKDSDIAYQIVMSVWCSVHGSHMNNLLNFVL